MTFRSSLVIAAVFATSVLAVSCGRPAGPLDVAPDRLRLHAHGGPGQIVLDERDYDGLYFKTTDSDPRCATSVTATPEPRKRGEPAHVDVTPVRAGSCDIYFFDDHGGRRRVAVTISPN